MTPPKPPRAERYDPTAIKGELHTASSRLGHSIIGVFARCALSLLGHTPKFLCEFRSEKGNTRDQVSAHAPYIAQAHNTKDIVIRGRYLVDGHGNNHSYCTHIQESLRASHYNCTYYLVEDKIWIVQTTPIAPNEELSIQFSKDDSFWCDRNDYPLSFTSWLATGTPSSLDLYRSHPLPCCPAPLWQPLP